MSERGEANEQINALHAWASALTRLGATAPGQQRCRPWLQPSRADPPARSCGDGEIFSGCVRTVAAVAAPANVSHSHDRGPVGRAAGAAKPGLLHPAQERGRVHQQQGRPVPVHVRSSVRWQCVTGTRVPQALVRVHDGACTPRAARADIFITAAPAASFCAATTVCRVCRCRKRCTTSLQKTLYMAHWKAITAPCSRTARRAAGKRTRSPVRPGCGKRRLATAVTLANERLAAVAVPCVGCRPRRYRSCDGKCAVGTGAPTML